MKNGRPLLFESEEELSEKIEEYFRVCDETIIRRIVTKKGDIIAEISKPYSVTGLAYFLNTNRQTLVNYEKKDGFFDTIKNAKARIEANYEENALVGDTNVTMSIFSLKNNYNWKDKTEFSTDPENPLAIDISSTLNKIYGPTAKESSDEVSTDSL